MAATPESTEATWFPSPPPQGGGGWLNNSQQFRAYTLIQKKFHISLE